jgi:predicted DNA-binding protein
MPKLQTMISDEMERKLQIYSAYLGISKSSYVKQILTFWLRKAEEDTIPQEIVKSVNKRIEYE